MVVRHYDLDREGQGFRVEVHGATGHMGAIRERDGAITKMAHLVRSLVFSRARVENIAGTPMRLALAGEGTGSGLVLEGGQGFVPTHGMQEVMERLRKAAHRGAESYLRLVGRTERCEEVVRVAYEKLRNIAFDGDPDSRSIRHARAAAGACGLEWSEPVLGWTVSCDARLFAARYPAWRSSPSVPANSSTPILIRSKLRSTTSGRRRSSWRFFCCGRRGRSGNLTGESPPMNQAKNAADWRLMPVRPSHFRT